MKAIDAVRRSAVAINPDDSISTAANVMERAGVGALAVIEHEALVGIVTDRGRLAIVRGGEFLGMLSVDDLIVDVARNLSSLSNPVRAEITSAHHDAPVPAPIAATAP